MTRGACRWPALLAASLFLLLTLAACPRPADESTAIGKVLDEQIKAVNDRDIDRYVKTLAKDYLHDPTSPFTERERLAHYFKNWPVLQVRASDRAIQIDGDDATATQQIHLAALDEAAGHRLRFTGPETLQLVHRGGTWYVRAADRDVDRILSILDTRRRAMEDRDLMLYLSALDPAYNDPGTEGKPGKDFDAVKQSMERQFGLWDGIDLEILDREIEVRDDAATAIQNCKMSVVKDGQPREFSFAERIRLSRNGAGAWRITGGL